VLKRKEEEKRMVEEVNKLDLTIRINEGFGAIKFGINKNDALTLLGHADKIYTTDFECTRWQYNNLMIELSFEPEYNDTLGWIEVYNREAKLFDYKLIGLKQNEVLNFLSSRIDEKPEIEDYGSFVSVNYESIWLELQFQFDKLININFGNV
jgi:hypothetical protein